MKLEAVSSKSEVVKIIKSSDVFGYVVDREKLVQVTQHNYYGTGFPFQLKCWPKT